MVAEDNAIEDTIYHMTRALDNERIDLDRFLKVSLGQSTLDKPCALQRGRSCADVKAIRMLGREQYMKRALIERILQGMGQTW